MDASSIAPQQRGRIHALDGLRGLAAMVVVLGHVVLASQPLMTNAQATGPVPADGSLEWLLTFTPMHIIWAGSEFVKVFFVLSGFVLTLPSVRGQRLRLGRYYPARMVRLYLPVWGALIAATVLHEAVSHRAVPGATSWLNLHSESLSTGVAAHDMLLVVGPVGYAFTDVIWSLKWEVLFSLALPLLLVCLPRTRVLSWAVVVLCFMLVVRSSVAGSRADYLLYLPIFVLGMELAFRREQLERLQTRLNRRTLANVLLKLVLAVVCICSLTADWWLPPGAGATGLPVLGACLAVVGTLTVGSFRRILESTPAQWVGKRSYSLYLVHLPVVVALAFALGGRPSVGVLLLLVIPLALAASVLFFRFVEYPAHRLAHWLGAYPLGETHPALASVATIMRRRL
jgi:peptidoglycan/LPS O-acetylase OafA/YrhL